MDNLAGRLKQVSFGAPPRVGTARVLRWDEEGTADRTIWRPNTYLNLVTALSSINLSRDGDVLYFFPGDHIELNAGNRVKLDEGGFAAWQSSDAFEPTLPRIWVYPAVDGKSPDRAPRGGLERRVQEGESASGQTVSSRSSGRPDQAQFRLALRGLDRKCPAPGCLVEYDASFDQADAAHLLPSRLMDLPKDHELYQSTLRLSGLFRSDIYSPRNGILLCKSHHATFDRFQWTVTDGKVEVAVGADSGIQEMAGLPFDLKRMPAQTPPADVWKAYITLIFADNGAALMTALSASKPKKAKQHALGKLFGWKSPVKANAKKSLKLKAAKMATF